MRINLAPDAGGLALLMAIMATSRERVRLRRTTHGSIATGNRWGGRHENAREVSRRRRQAERSAAR